ncbi:hypothetical protein PoB_002265200 [Plakobranchus ocellatus]|uniref:Uncharacterized protein n=1 Tax=Plakobranchus ocellatus TaxID=259542 RepID=A0AAV3ZNC0_9GAST|nr:hypothetical protein PoB_002265200 [Plakobranchus ocellatus]
MNSHLACLLVLACLCASTLAGGYGFGVMPYGLGLGLGGLYGGYGMGLGLGGMYGMGMGFGGLYGGLGMGFGYPGIIFNPDAKCKRRSQSEQGRHNNGGCFNMNALPVGCTTDVGPSASAFQEKKGSYRYAPVE